jgi:hypothetical protein
VWKKLFDTCGEPCLLGAEMLWKVVEARVHRILWSTTRDCLETLWTTGALVDPLWSTETPCRFIHRHRIAKSRTLSLAYAVIPNFASSTASPIYRNNIYIDP